MPSYSRNQAKLAASLIQGAKTAKELREELGLPLNEIENDLAKLIKLKVVEKLGGYPTKYQATEAVRRGLMSEKPTEEHVLRAHIIIEGQSKQKKALEDATRDMITRLQKDTVITASNIKEADIEQEGENFANLFEADISAKNLEDMVYAVLTYGPSSIELEPFHDYVLKSDEAQGIVMDIATVLQTYATTLVQRDFQIRDYRENSPEIFIK